MKPQKIVRFISLAALFIIPLFPLIIANWYFFPFITGKAFFFRILVELAFFSWIILAFLEPKYRPKVTPLSIGVTVFALITLLADLLGVNPIRSLWSNFERMEGWIVIIHLWAFYITTSSLFGSGDEGRKMWHRWFNVSLLVALIVAGYGLFQLFGWAETHQGTRVDASLGNAAYMAVYMLMNAGIAAYMFFAARARRIVKKVSLSQWAYGILFVLFSVIVVETATRGTTLGLVGGIILTCLIYSIFGRGEPKRWRWVSAGIVGLVVLVGVLFWFNRSAPFIQNNEVLRRMAEISWSDTSNQARQYIWPMALKGAMERPILGWGQENFNYIFNSKYDANMWGQEQWFDRAHNVYLDWLTASGLVGLIAYLALYILLLISVWRSSLNMADKSVITGLIAAYAVHNIFVFDNLASYVLFFAMLGFTGSLRENHAIKWFGTKPVGNDAVEYIVAPISLVLLVAIIYLFNVRPIQANTRLITALISCQGNGNNVDASYFQKALDVNVYVANQEIREQLLSCARPVLTAQQVPGPTKQAFFAMASKAIEDQIAATPNDARIYVLAGSFMNAIGQYKESEPLLTKAHELSPAKQTIDFELAEAYINLDRKSEALALLKQAYESAPNYPMAKASYAGALVINGDEATAHKIFGEDPAIFDTAQMAQSYLSVKAYDKAIVIYKKLVAANPTDVNTRVALSQIQYAAGQIANAISTLRSIEEDHPEYKDQIEAAIKQAQK